MGSYEFLRKLILLRALHAQFLIIFGFGESIYITALCIKLDV